MNKEKGKDVNGGYCGSWMSKGARDAIRNNVKPWDLWGHKKLVCEIIKKNPGVDRAILNSLDDEILKNIYLGYAKWHHMGENFTQVLFYKVCKRDLTTRDLVACVA